MLLLSMDGVIGNIIYCGRIRGYKLETKQVVALATHKLAMKRSLQELLSVFGLLIGPHVSDVVAIAAMLQHIMGQQ